MTSNEGTALPVIRQKKQKKKQNKKQTPIRICEIILKCGAFIPDHASMMS